MVSGEVELPDPSARYVVASRDGSRIPVAVDSVRAERAIDTTFPAAEFQATIAGLSQPSVLGRTVNRYEIAERPDSTPLLKLWRTTSNDSSKAAPFRLVRSAASSTPDVGVCAILL